MKTVGERIRHIRTERNLTLEELAERAHISKSFLWSVENDKSGISGEHLLNLADALDASVEFIMRGSTKDTTAVPPTIEIPKELSQMAEHHGLSFKETRVLLQTQESIIARRSNKADVQMTEAQWLNVWNGIKDLIREKAIK